MILIVTITFYIVFYFLSQLFLSPISVWLLIFT